ncbi:MAG: beta-glucuronidase [Prevotella sp.]|nr:beta-glucuronidase [Prevotella sp.]
MKRYFCFAVCCWLFALGHLHAQQVIDLSGMWEFSMGDEPKYNDYVMLPGSMLTNDKGTPVSVNTQWTGSLYDSSYYFNPYMERYRQEGNMKFPFFLTPERHYTGNAWYRRTIYVPKDWSDQRIVLFLERPHIETTVFVNGREVGHQMSLSVPHEYDVTKYMKAGERNEIAIRVYNGIENVCVGQDSHSVTDQTQGNWNGIAGRIELQAQWKRLNIRNVRIIPDLSVNVLTVEVQLENHVDGVRFFPLNDYLVSADIRPLHDGQVGRRPLHSSSVEAEGSKVRLSFFLSQNMKLWDEFHPNLYRLTVRAGETVYETQFGLRDISIRGRQMLINGRPLFLRGTVENCLFPETGYPPTDEDEWVRIFKKCKEYGLNHVRFHSYCPPDAAFCAADRVGIYLQPEGPSWPNHGVRLRRGQAIDEYLLEESKRIVDTYGHHPSFVMMAAGNEPAGDWVSYCNDWVKTMHEYDSTRVYCGASVGGGWAWDGGSEYHVKGGARGLDWDRHAPGSDDDYYSQIEFPRNYKGSEPNQTPIVAHEQGQWCVFPDFKEIPQYTGAYKARNLEIFRDLLRDNGMEAQAEKFLMASGRLQTLCYKYEIERNLRTKDYTGFQLLGLNDYSGQGTALVGPLNVFWREKGYVGSRQWREFCNPMVLLARFPKFVYTNRDTLLVPVEAYNALYGDVVDGKAAYQIWRNELTLFAADTLYSGTVPVGKNHPLGTIRVPLDSITEPTKMTLAVSMGNFLINHWDFWVYPAESDEGEVINDKFLVADSLDAEALKTLKKGGTVLLLAAGRVTLGSDVKQTYLPVFWNTSWFKMRPPNTTGAYIDRQHPLFRHGFPTDDWANLNWWELLNRAQVMNLRELPQDYQSPIQPIDTWHVSRKLGMLIEARVGKGRLLMTTMDITSDLEHRHVARQMRRAIIDYMQSDDFQPTLTLDEQTIGHFFTEQAPPVNMFTNDSPDELKPKIK